jgi:hypothetical protein
MKEKRKKEGKKEGRGGNLIALPLEEDETKRPEVLEGKRTKPHER